MAMAQLDNLRLLSLNGWDDFQEYSLQLVLESCSRLSHLSLGENNFTRFTLESFAKSHSTSVIPGIVTSGKTEDAVVKLERYDDPIKGGNGSSIHYSIIGAPPLQLSFYTIFPAKESPGHDIDASRQLFTKPLTSPIRIMPELFGELNKTMSSTGTPLVT
ncbi:hypothetical protein BGX24_005001 [Mortierella sp. AD032]|nr:hypothetical protein BGX24_005001 [Mortierella sp. AD032]